MGSHDARFAKRNVPLVAYDNMVMDLDAQDLTGLHQGLCDREVGVRWSRITAWMVVHEHHAMRRAYYRCAKDFARMRDRLVQRTDGHEVVATNSLLHVEQQDDEAFTVRIEMRSINDVRAPVGYGVGR